MEWEKFYSKAARVMKPSAIREILKITQQPDIISFAGGLPGPEVFPVEIVKKITNNVLEQEGSTALQYSTSEGYFKLRECLALRMKMFGIKTTPENILITSGSQQALDILGKVFINEGDTIVVEAPSYLGALQAFKPYLPNYVSIEMDEDGMRTDLLREKIEAMDVAPKFIYTVPTFHNPAGVTMSLERRKEILRIAEEFGIPIIEDNPYGELRYYGKDIPPIKAFDKKDIVIYLSTFSKIFAPGFRLAWIVADKNLIRKCVITKQATDLCTSAFVQKIAYHYCKNYLEQHVEKIKNAYRKKRDVMLEAMEKYFPKEVKWTKPEGGMFVWVTLPEGMSAKEILPKAVEKKVAYVEGSSFFVNGGENHMRINFSHESPEEIVKGIKRLGEVIKEELH